MQSILQMCKCENQFGFTFIFHFVKCLKDILKNYVASKISSKCNHTVEQSSPEGVQKKMEIIFKIFLAFVLSFVTLSTSVCYTVERYNSEVNVKFLKKLVKISDILFVLFLAIFSIAYGTDFLLFVLLLSVVLSFVILFLYCVFIDRLW